LIHQVKRYQAESIQNPICVTSEMSVAEVMDLQSRYQISAIPVIDSATRQLIGIISKRDIKDDIDPLDLVTKIMTSENLITLDTHADPAQALDLMKQHRLEQIILVDTDRRCTGLITAKDHTHIQNHPEALMDKHSRLRVGASIGTDSHDLDRVSMLIDEQVDSLFVTGTTLHSKATSDMVTHIRRQRSAQIDVIAGPVMTVAAATALIDAGANALFMPLKTPDIYLNHGMDLPSFGVLMDLVEACNVSNTALFIDYPTQLDHRTKALAGGASGFMISNTDLDGDTLSEKCILPLKNEIYQALSLTGCTSLGELRTMPRFALKRR
jgi:IMP dehydrogenase